MTEVEELAGARRTSHGQERETWLEHQLAGWRYRRSLAFLRRVLHPGGSLRGLDLGCGFHGPFVSRANRLPGVEFVGADLDVDPDRQELLALDLEAPREIELPFPPDIVTMHAVLEHLEDPAVTLAWVAAHLAPGGHLLATVPSPRAKPVLEFLAFRLGWISAREIRDHKDYFDRASLEALLDEARAGGGTGLELVEHGYFQAGFNNWLVARKTA